MARKLRVECPSAIYHGPNRADRREAIVQADEGRRCFLDPVGEAWGKSSWQVHALGLRPKHFHLELETPQTNLLTGMKWFLISQGWCLRPDPFRKELLEQTRERFEPEHYGAERHESAASQAQAIVAEEPKRRRWEVTHPERPAKGDAGKLRRAQRLRAETKVTVRWIAERLRLGTAGYVNHLLIPAKKARTGVICTYQDPFTLAMRIFPG